MLYVVVFPHLHAHMYVPYNLLLREMIFYKVFVHSAQGVQNEGATFDEQADDP